MMLDLFLLSRVLKSCTPNHRKEPKTPRKQDFLCYPSESLKNWSFSVSAIFGDFRVRFFRPELLPQFFLSYAKAAQAIKLSMNFLREGG
jgi:hypothetical protein